MQSSLFFNALPNEAYATGYDRNYDADAISNWLGIIISTGVIKNGLAVTPASSGLGVSVAVGKACINGKGYCDFILVDYRLCEYSPVRAFGSRR